MGQYIFRRVKREQFDTDGYVREIDMSEIIRRLMKLAFIAVLVGLHGHVAAEDRLPPASIFDMAEMLDV